VALSQTITFPVIPAHTSADGPITLAATASSGLPITYTVTGPATLAGNVLTLTGPGSVSVTALQGGSAGAGIFVPGVPATVMLNWEDQFGGGDGSYGNGTIRIIFDGAGHATMEWLGTLVGTASTNAFGIRTAGVNGTALVGTTVGAGPVAITPLPAVGAELIVYLTNAVSAGGFFTGPASRNPDGYFHCYIGGDPAATGYLAATPVVRTFAVSAISADAWLVIYEAGGAVDRSSYLSFAEGASHSFSLQNRHRGTAAFMLEIPAGDTYMPERGCLIKLYDPTGAGGSPPVYAGTIDVIDVAWKGDDGTRVATLNCVSLEKVFDAILVPPRLYTNQTAYQIVVALFALVDGSPVLAPDVPASDSSPVVPSLLCDYDRISDLFDQLAKRANFVWGVDPQTMQLFFHAPNAEPSPFTLTCDDVFWESCTWNVNGQDFRDWQAVRISPEAFTHSKELFTGDGSTGFFTLMRPPKQITNVWQTRNTQNTATGTFSGVPAAGDTATIGYPGAGGGTQYNWAASSPYAIGQSIIDPAGHVQKVSTAGQSGTTEPVWNDIGSFTVDQAGLLASGVIWQDNGISGLDGSGGNLTYTFVAALDNTQWGQVLIGSDAAATARNFVDAINRVDDLAGVTFSMPTWENPLVNADPPSGGSFVVRNKSAGKGYVAALSDSGSAFSWSAAITSGGITTFNTTSLEAAVEGTSNTADVYYTPGNPVVGPVIPRTPTGYYLQIEYTRVGGDIIIVEDTALVAARAAIETGTGKYQQIISDSSNTSAPAGLLEAQATLNAYKIAPTTMQFQTFRRGITPGQLLTITLVGPGHDPANPGHAPFLANATWAVQEVSAELVPGVKPHMPMTGAGHYKYTLHVVDAAQVADYIDFWESLGGGGGSTAPAIQGRTPEAPGPIGPAPLPAAAVIVTAIPVGAIDGSNAVFTLPSVPRGPLDLFLNGVWQMPEDVALAGSTVTYARAPEPGDGHTAHYPG
jgi:hypothetical protein